MPYAADPALADFIQRLPKTETHLHLDGAVPFSLLQKLDPAEFRDPPPSWADDFRFDSFDHFLAACNRYCRDFYSSADRFHEASRIILGTCSAQNCQYVEVSFNISLLAGIKESPGEVLRAIRQAAPPGLELRIFAGMCHDDYTGLCRELIDEAVLWPDLDGLDLHGTESLPLEPWTAKIWSRARANGKYTKAHAGEFLGADFVRRVLDELQPQRIEHGVRALEDPALVERLCAERVALDVCPISNLKLQVHGVPTLAHHPIRPLFDAGVCVTVNTDDPLIFGNSLSEEYVVLHQHLGFTTAELKQIAANGFRVALLPEATKAEWIDTIARIPEP
jgi:adenosine deaminase